MGTGLSITGTCETGNIDFLRKTLYFVTKSFMMTMADDGVFLLKSFLSFLLDFFGSTEVFLSQPNRPR